MIATNNQQMQTVSYDRAGEVIQSGDLLIWSKNTISTISNAVLELIRIATLSDYAHVGIAWKVSGRLFVIEATMPSIHIAPVSALEEFYFLNMGIDFTSEAQDWLLSKVGLKYSIDDALRAMVGKTCEADDRWQCAELANKFYKSVGRDFGEAYTPGQLVSAAVEVSGSSVVRVSPTAL